MATATAESQPRLLSLPAELRNQIYRMVLVQSEPFEISSEVNVPREPHLLSTCRQIRRETLNIFYRENTFGFVFRDLDPTVYLEWCRRSPHKRDARITYEGNDFEEYEQVPWANFFCWAEAYFDGECDAPGGCDLEDEDGDSTVEELFRMFDLVDLCRKRFFSWSATKEKLEVVREVLEIYG